ncbi:MAG: 5-(carboxyamino)imidazole ribonucleotide mutase [bacterium]|nr:5-(carboxyamino)imidazole ribonucleotide mutase [bacterium]
MSGKSEKKVAVLLGSASDKPVMDAAFEILREFGVGFTGRVLSAHRTPEEVVRFVAEAEAGGVEIFICGAGMAAHLAGTVAANTTKPVLTVPLESGGLGGLDALLASVQMPGGVPVAVFALGRAGAQNAALFAIQCLALSDKELASRLAEHRESQRVKVRRDDGELQRELGDGE